MSTTEANGSGSPLRTAFVLTGGGSLGAVQAGMIAALHDHGIEPDVLVGTSVGAVNAAYLAGPGAPHDRVEELTKLWRQMKRRDVFVVDPRRWVRAAAGAVPSLFAGEPLRELLTARLGYAAFEDARCELAVTATDVVTGAALVIDHGPVIDAVAASAAVPGLLPPVSRAGRTLVDGAVGHAESLGYADERGVDDIYLLPAGYPCAGAAPESALAVALTALALLLHRQLIEEVRRYAGQARLHVVPPLCPLAVSPGDFHQADGLIDRGYSTTAAWLDGGGGNSEPLDGVLSFHGPHHA